MKRLCLLLGILCTAQGSYKVPAHDPCILGVLLCDDYTVPFTVVDNSILEMFNKIEDLTSVCDKLTKFRVCLKNAEQFCTEIYKSDFGLKLLKNRRLAFDLCEPGSASQKLYLAVERCVNRHSYPAMQFCTNKADQTVGLNFDLEDLERECRYLGAIESCQCAVVTDQCGDIAGNFFKKLLVFRSERDFMCVNYEREKLEHLDSISAVVNSYAQEYRDLASQMENNLTDKHDRDFKARQEGFKQEKNSFEYNAYIDHESAFGTKTSRHTTNQPLHSVVSNNMKFDSTCSSPMTTKSIEQDFCVKNYACKTKTPFLLSYFGNGPIHHVGCGLAHILWATASPLEDTFCSWQTDPRFPSKIFKCSIRVDGQCDLIGESSEGEVERNALFDLALDVYEPHRFGFKKVAQLYVPSFFPTSDGKLGGTVNFNEKKSSDIRYWCAKEANLYEEQDQVLSTSRMGLMPPDFSRHSMANKQGKSFDEKYNFYAPVSPKYLVDTEIRLMSSVDDSLESEKLLDDMLQRDYEEVSDPFRNVATLLGEKDLDEPDYLHPFKPSKSSHLYRPGALFRPRLGENLDAEDAEKPSDYLEMSAEEKVLNLDAAEHVYEDSYTNQYAEEICPLLPENISKLFNKYRVYSEKSYGNMADLLNGIESKYYKKFPTSKNEQDVLHNMIEDTECNQEKDAEEIYVVTPSAELRAPSEIYHAVSGDAAAQQTADEDFKYLSKGSGQDFTEVLDTEAGDLTVEDTEPADPQPMKLDFIDNIFNDPFSYKFFYKTTNHESSYEKLPYKSNSVFQKIESDTSN